MSNPYYSVTGAPITGSPGASAVIRGEFALIAAAFNLLPQTLTANTAVVVNSGGTGMTVTNNSGSITLAAALSASSANPSAVVGPTAVNGSASTFMTSDSAPALNEAANFALTGTWEFESTVEALDSASGGPFLLGYLGTPPNTQSGTGGYTLVAADRGKRITLTTAGNTITIPTSIFANGDVVTILVPQTGTETIAPASGFTLNWANGTTASGGSGAAGDRTLTGWATATLEFTSATVAFISGAGIS